MSDTIEIILVIIFALILVIGLIFVIKSEIDFNNKWRYR